MLQNRSLLPKVQVLCIQCMCMCHWLQKHSDDVIVVTNVNYFHGDVCLRSLKSYPHGISPLILEMRERLKRVMNKSTAKRGNSIEEQSLHKFI